METELRIKRVTICEFNSLSLSEDDVDPQITPVSFPTCPECTTLTNSCQTCYKDCT